MPKGVYHHQPKPLIERYWARVIVGDDCWSWRGYLSSGYGRLGSHTGGPHLYAHRVAWELRNGPIPEGLEVCHTCDNPPCTRPSHLFLGTRRDNAQDMVKKGRTGHQKRRVCKEGHPLVQSRIPSIKCRHCPICFKARGRDYYLKHKGAA